MINDNVNHPSHYTDGKIEVIDFIEDKGLGFHLGNAVKYIARAGKKDPAKDVEDLEKAGWYLRREIERRKALRGDSPEFKAESGNLLEELVAEVESHVAYGNEFDMDAFAFLVLEVAHRHGLTIPYLDNANKNRPKNAIGTPAQEVHNIEN